MLKLQRISQKNRFQSQSKTKLVNAVVIEEKDKAKCIACDFAHPKENCVRFQNFSSGEKCYFVKKNRCCFNWLRVDHHSKECREESCGKGVVRVDIVDCRMALREYSKQMPQRCQAPSP